MRPRGSYEEKPLTLSHTVSALCHSKCKWKSKRQEVRGRSKRLAQLSPARIGGLRTKIWAGVVPPASGTPTQLAESVDPTEGHSLRGCGAQRGDGGSRADIRYFTSAEDTMAGQRDTVVYVPM